MKSADKEARMSLYKIAHVISWLRKHDLPPDAIGRAFGARADYVSRVASWWEHSGKKRQQPPPRHTEILRYLFDFRPAPNLAASLAMSKKNLGIRSHVRQDKGSEKADRILSQARELSYIPPAPWAYSIDVLDLEHNFSCEDRSYIVARNKDVCAEKHLRKIIAALYRLSGKLGRPATSSLIQARAQLFRKTAFLHLQAGHCWSALHDASRSLLLFRFAASRPRDLANVDFMAVVWTVAEASQLRGDCHLAIDMLELARKTIKRGRLGTPHNYVPYEPLQFLCRRSSTKDFLRAIVQEKPVLRRKLQRLRLKNLPWIRSEWTLGQKVILRFYGEETDARSCTFYWNMLSIATCGLHLGLDGEALRLIERAWNCSMQDEESAIRAHLLKATPMLFPVADERRFAYLCYVASHLYRSVLANR